MQEEPVVIAVDADDSDGVNDQVISNLIRLAFACEAGKRPLRREEIVSLVLGEKNGRLLRTLLRETNAYLAETFGMRLVPLPSVARSQSTLTVAGRRALTSAKRQESVLSSQGTTTASTAASAYVLQTVMERRPSLGFHRQPGQLALLATVLCLCRLSEEGMIEEGLLYERLASLGHKGVDLEGGVADWLATLRRQRYLVINKKSDDANVNYYAAGPRAAIEFPPASLINFILDVGDLAGIPPEHLRPRVSHAFRVD